MITTSGTAVDRVTNRRIAGVVPVEKQMYTCMSLLAAGVDTGYDATNKGSRLAGTTGTQSTVYGTMTGSRTGTPTDTTEKEFTFWLRHIRCLYLLRKGGSVKFTVPREFSFNRFNGMRASLKTSELHRILERKIMRPVWFWPKFILHTVLKTRLDNQKAKYSKFSAVCSKRLLV